MSNENILPMSKQRIINWLKEKPRTHEEIANKTIEAMEETYDGATNHFLNVAKKALGLDKNKDKE